MEDEIFNTLFSYTCDGKLSIYEPRDVTRILKVMYSYSQTPGIVLYVLLSRRRL